MMLFQPTKGYRYNSDTLVLYDFISSFFPKGKLLDVGCGCGILALLLKRDFPSLEVHALDIQKDNCTLTKANAQHNALALESLTCKDFLTAPFEFLYDIIVSNPPFYHEGSCKSENEHLHVSRYSAHLPFDAFAKKVSKSLSNRGYFIFCYDAKQIQTLMVGLENAGLRVENLCFVHSKEENDASLVLIRARKNSKSVCKIHPPHIVSTALGYTAKMHAIFEKSNTKSLQWKD